MATDIGRRVRSENDATTESSDLKLASLALGNHSLLSPSPSPTELSPKDPLRDSEEQPTTAPTSLPKSPKHPQSGGGVRRLSASRIAQLTESLPIAAIPDNEQGPRPVAPVPSELHEDSGQDRCTQVGPLGEPLTDDGRPAFPERSSTPVPNSPAAAAWEESDALRTRKQRNSIASAPQEASSGAAGRPKATSVPQSPATTKGMAPPRRHSHNIPPRPEPLHLDSSHSVAYSVGAVAVHGRRDPAPSPAQAQQTLDLFAGSYGRGEIRAASPLPPSVPLPPMSLPTLLQLELAGERPSPLYIHRSHTSDMPYESNAVKFERLKNFLVLPTYLERTMHFGVLACLDAWLWTLTILPIRFCMAVGVLVRWWAYVVNKEVRWLTAYVWRGLGRMRKRARKPQRTQGDADDGGRKRPRETSHSSANGSALSAAEAVRQTANGVHEGDKAGMAAGVAPLRTPSQVQVQPPPAGGQKHLGHRRTKSMPSNLTSFHKADLLQGAVILCSCVALVNLDASRMYHFIRAQSAVKLYVIYNLVEVGDRLLSAVGQDVFECLFSAETLSRTASGRSKLLLPFGMFLLSLVYNIAHTVVLFYQVITLNVAVNSYSNALLSLLMSNQFVEVKSSVFKRTEKENTFQLACADIVERFQLWVVLLIIALRNIVEIGGLSVPGAGGGFDLGGGGGGLGGGGGGGVGDDMAAKVPLHNAAILPASFTILPAWLVSVEVLSPFLIVVGSEMVIDWIKHGYINKFNNIKPTFYSRVLDILCKDYYTNSFVAPALTRRLGLPLIPLCTLFLRSSVQTYHMFLATHVPPPLPPSTHTSLSVDSMATPSSPAIAASLERLDTLIRGALGRAVYGNPYSATGGSQPGGDGGSGSGGLLSWTSDDVIAGATMVVVFFLTFLLLLILKLLLGMALLRYSRNRYVRMKLQEHAEATGQAAPESFDALGRRTGRHGKVEVGDDRRRWLFQDDADGLKKVRDRELKASSKGKAEIDLSAITRYEMIAKRIW